MILNNIKDVKDILKDWKINNNTVALVPTMGALHQGHASLIKKAREIADKVIVSIFVNPIQFGPNEDFDKYPRKLETDEKICNELGVDFIFAPSPKEMYGENTLINNNNFTYVCPPFKIVDCLCGKSRNGHFDGVATVVLKLFNICKPDFACFGLKDAQQLFILKKMVKDLNLDVNIIPCPIVRESDGLALSSRNSYLSADERKSALSISKALFYIKELYGKGIKDTSVLFDSAISVLDKSLDLEYLEFRDYDTFQSITEVKNNTLVAIAVKIGKTRLIDNVIL